MKDITGRIFEKYKSFKKGRFVVCLLTILIYLSKRETTLAGMQPLE
jgi:hypothetical protein